MSCLSSCLQIDHVRPKSGTNAPIECAISPRLPISTSEGCTRCSPILPFQREAGGLTLNEINGQNALASSELTDRPLSRRLPNHTVSDLLIPLSAAIEIGNVRLAVVRAFVIIMAA